MSRYERSLCIISTAFKDVKGGAVSRADEKSQGKRQRAV